MPYKLLDYKPPDIKSTKGISSPATGTDNNDHRKPHLMFLVHERASSIGGVQRHSARLRDGLGDNYKVERVNWKNPKNKLPLNLPGLYLKTKNGGYGLIYCDDGVSSIVGTGICKRLNKKVIATVHGLDIIVPLPGYQPIIINAIRRLDKLVCVSRATANQAIKRGVDPEKVTVIPNAAEQVNGIPSRDEALYNEIKALTGIELNDKKILFSLGRPLKRKGFDRFIDKVFPHLPDDYIYIVAGPKPNYPSWLDWAGRMLGVDYRQKLELALGIYTVHERLLRLSDHPRVYYLNGVSEKLRDLLFAVSDLFLMPNRAVEGDMEGFGIVALEAAVRGVPVIATGIEGITDAVIDGENGYCIPEGKDREMARAIMELIDDSDQIADLGRHAREFTLSRFAIESVVAKYEKIFDELLQDGRNYGS